jgi:SAM-dependent methyltransferase
VRYYDHETAYRQIAERGGKGWDDLPGQAPNSEESYLALRKFLDSPLAPPPGGALDLGCGGGQASMLLAARGHRVTGVEYSATAVELARKNAPAIRFVRGDCTALELPSESFDLAIDNHVLHCMVGPDRQRFAAEVARVLRPGGIFFSDTMSREGRFRPDAIGCDPKTFIATSGRRYWTSAKELDELLGLAGFEILFRCSRTDEWGDTLERVARRP